MTEFENLFSSLKLSVENRTLLEKEQEEDLKSFNEGLREIVDQEIEQLDVPVCPSCEAGNLCAPYSPFFNNATEIAEYERTPLELKCTN